MSTTTDPRVQQIAAQCIENMGDIFWDYIPERDVPLEFSDPRQIATSAVEVALQDFAEKLDTSEVYPGRLRDEYACIVSTLPEKPTNDALLHALVSQAEWTEQGARAVVELARRYGTSVLRNALALADALEIEDGEAGL